MSKTLTEKADELLEQLIYCDFRTEIGIDKAKKLIRKSLLNQDKDTRKACANLVITTPPTGVSIYDKIINCEGGRK